MGATGLYVAGFVTGLLPGQTGGGGGAADVDAFVRKYDFNGNELWTRQFGIGRTEVAPLYKDPLAVSRYLQTSLNDLDFDEGGSKFKSPGCGRFRGFDGAVRSPGARRCRR